MTLTVKRYFHLSSSTPARARLEEAEQFFLAQNLNEALAAAQQAWREHPRDPDVFRILAYIHMARGEYQPAAQASYQSVLFDGENAASFAILTQVYITFNMLGLAEETLQKARARFPEDAALMVLHSDVLFRRNNSVQAENLAKEALLYHADDAYARSLLGAYYVRKRRYADAAPHLRAAVDAYPQRWDYLRDLGISLLRTGRLHEAREALEKSFRLNMQDLTSKHNLYLALRSEQSSQQWYWHTVRFFFDHSWLAWLLEIFGWIAIIVAVAHFLNADAARELNTMPSIYKGALWLGGSIMGLLFVHPALKLRGMKGRKFDRYLWKAIGGAQLQVKGSDEQ